jgi:hypothetical protein
VQRSVQLCFCSVLCMRFWRHRSRSVYSKYAKDRSIGECFFVFVSLGFLRLPERRLSCLKFVVVLLTSLQRAPVYYRKLRRFFLPYYLKFIIPNHLIIQWRVISDVKKPKRTGTIIYFCRTQQFFSEIIKSHITDAVVFFIHGC